MIPLAMSGDKIPSDDKRPTIEIPTKHQNLREPKNDKSLIMVLLLVYKRPLIHLIESNTVWAICVR